MVTLQVRTVLAEHELEQAAFWRVAFQHVANLVQLEHVHAHALEEPSEQRQDPPPFNATT